MQIKTEKILDRKSQGESKENPRRESRQCCSAWSAAVYRRETTCVNLGPGPSATPTASFLKIIIVANTAEPLLGGRNC